jgi:putative ABC transport system substrate-binding protein
VPVSVPASRRFEEVFSGMTRTHPHALIVLPGEATTTHRVPIVTLALKSRLPTLYAWRMGPESGALMSYGVDITDNFRRAATYVDRILRGAKPGELPVEQPTKFELAINLRTARALASRSRRRCWRGRTRSSSERPALTRLRHDPLTVACSACSSRSP